MDGDQLFAYMVVILCICGDQLFAYMVVFYAYELVVILYITEV
jgi:hypothetical protein